MKAGEYGMKWVADCGGKKNYDCDDLVSVSTRYWGANHFYVGSKPSASSAVYLKHVGEHDEPIVVSRCDFEGNSFEQVTIQVESWVQEQILKVESALREKFSFMIEDEAL